MFPRGRDGVLLTLVGILAVQIPTTIAQVEPSWLRAIIQVCTLMLVVAFAIKIKPPSDPMPPQTSAPDITPEPITIPDPPVRRFSLYLA